MKNTLAIATITALFAAGSPAEEDKPGLAGHLQQGLVEEEVHRDPEAALAHYQKLLEDFDAGRRFAATALFRSAECQRKLGDEEAAAADLQRLLREFPEQEKLAALAGQNLAALGVEVAAAQEPAGGGLELTAAEADRMKELRKLAAESPDVIAGDGTRLGEAVKANHSTAVEFLLEHGADANSYRLREAAEIGNLRICEMLLEAGAEVNLITLQAAIEHRRPAILDLLLKRLGNEGEVDLQALGKFCIEKNNIDAFKRLEAAGLDLATPDSEGYTFVHQAVVKGWGNLLDYLLDEKGLAADTRSSLGITPLDLAAQYRRIDLVNRLIAAGADVNNRSSGDYLEDKPNWQGLTPLMRALGPGYSRQLKLATDCVEALLAAGADIDAADASGNRPVHYALGNAIRGTGDFRNPQSHPQTPAMDFEATALPALFAAGAKLRSDEYRNLVNGVTSQSSLYSTVRRYALLSGEDRGEYILLGNEDGWLFQAFSRIPEDRVPPRLVDAILESRVAATHLHIHRPGEGPPQEVDVAALCRDGEAFPALKWGDLVMIGEGADEGEVLLVRDRLLADLKRTVTVSRGELEAAFTVYPPLEGYPEVEGLYDPSAGVVHGANSAQDLVTKAFLLTPYSSRAVAKLVRADGEVLNVSLVDGAAGQPVLRDGDRLEIVEAEHLGAPYAITCDQRLLWWEPEGGMRSAADYLGAAFGGSTPFVISRPDFTNLSGVAEREAPDPFAERATFGEFEWDLLAEDGREPPKGVVLMNVPFSKPPAEGEGEWTGLPHAEFKWLEDKLAIEVHVQALDLPTRTLAVGPERFRYRSEWGLTLRESIPAPDGDRFDARGRGLDRLVINAGYQDDRLFRWQSAYASDAAGTTVQRGAAWLWDGAVIKIEAPRSNAAQPDDLPATAIEAIRRASQQGADPGARVPRRRVVLPPSR